MLFCPPLIVLRLLIDLLRTSIFHKKISLNIIPKFRDFKKIHLSTFIYKLILIQNCKNANIIKTQILYFLFRDIKKIHPSTFIYKLILIKIFMNANIKEENIFFDEV